MIEEDKKMYTYKEIVEKFYKGERIVGMGSGKTATRLMKYLHEVLDKNTQIVGTSTQTDIMIRSYNIHPIEMQGIEKIDVYFDGADYVDNSGNIIKGYGGALTLEKIAIHASDVVVIVVQKHKRVQSLETLFVPVEVLKDALFLFTSYLEKHSVKYSIRLSVKTAVYITDNGNMIVDVEYNKEILEEALKMPGVLAHGLVEPSEKIKVFVVDDLL